MRLTRVLFLAVGLLFAAGGFSRAGAAIGQLWARHYADSSAFDELDHFVSVTSDAQGNVYVAGTSRDTVSDSLCYITTKYDQWGRKVWQSHLNYSQWYFNELDTAPPSPHLVLDNAHGRLYLVATERLDFYFIHDVRAVKYNTADGSIIWSNMLRLGNVSQWTDDYVSDIVFDSVYGALYICATSQSYVPGVDSAAYHWGIARLDTATGFPSSTGWQTLYRQSPGDTFGDYATGITLSPARDPIVCGSCYSDGNALNNWVTASFSRTNGSLQWATPWRRDSITLNEYPWSITADTSGIYVGGAVYIDSSGQYDWALLKLRLNGSIVDSAICNVSPDVFYDNWLTSVKSTVGSGGRVYAAGVVDDDNTNSLDWLVVGYSTGAGQAGGLSYLWKKAVDDDANNDDVATQLVLDGLNQLWVMGSIDQGASPNDTTEWMVRRFKPADGSTLGLDLVYYRNDLGGDVGVPTSFAFRDTNHVYLGGFTEPDVGAEDQTVVRFGGNVPSAAMDSFRDSIPFPGFAWRDTVDSGSTVRVRAYYHSTGYSLATPKLKASLSPFYADSVTDTIGAPPESARSVLMTGRWTALQRGPQVMKCTLDLAGDTSAGNNLRTRNVFVRVNDVGPDSLGVADTVDEGIPFTPAARVQNYGNTTVTFQIAFQVGDTIKTATVNALPPDSARRITFSQFTMPRGAYAVRTYTQFAPDLRRSNDTLDRPANLFVRYLDIVCRGILTPTGNLNDSAVVTPSAAFKNLGNVTTTFRADFVIPLPSDQSALRSPQFAIGSPQSEPRPAPGHDLTSSAQREASGVIPSLSTPQPPAGSLALLRPRSLTSRPGTRKSAILSPHSGVPTPQFAVRTSRSSVRTPQSAFAPGTPYHDSILSITLAPAESSVRTFSSWLATPTGNYQATCYSTYALDRLHSNDTAHQSFTVSRHDVGVVSILAPRDTVQQGNVTPQAVVHNYGNATETFKVFLRVAGGTPWSDSAVAIVRAGQDSTASFGTWPAIPGSYSARCSTCLATDVNPRNDTLGNAFVVVQHDVGVAAILAPRDTVPQGNVTPRATVHNYGSVPETFKVYFRITGGTPWIDSFALILPNGGDSTISFRNWGATSGSYSGKCSTGLAVDANRSNDTLTAGFVVVQHDVGVAAIVAPRGVLDSGTAVIPRAVVRNLGSVTENFRVRFEIGSLYADSQPENLAPGAADTLGFAGWIASPLGLLVTSCSTMLAGDANPANDRLTDSVRVIPLTGLEEGRLALPPAFMLDAPKPNPFRMQTVIRYGLPRAAHVAVGIYSATGAFLTSLYCGTQRAGYYSLSGDLGSLPEGVYYCRLVSDEFRAVRKLVKVH